MAVVSTRSCPSQRDYGGVDAGFQQPHRHGVAQCVGGDVFPVQ
jgi:hypothetical protein